MQVLNLLKIQLFPDAKRFIYVNPAFVVAVMDANIEDTCFIVMAGDVDGGVQVALSAGALCDLLAGVRDTY